MVGVDRPPGDGGTHGSAAPELEAEYIARSGAWVVVSRVM